MFTVSSLVIVLRYLLATKYPSKNFSICLKAESLYGTNDICQFCWKRGGCGSAISILSLVLNCLYPTLYQVLCFIQAPSSVAVTMPRNEYIVSALGTRHIQQ